MNRLRGSIRLLVVALVLAAGCDMMRTIAEPIDGGVSDVDSDADSDSDTDTDADSDSDSDTDTGTDTSVIPMDCSECPSIGNDLENLICAIDICDEEVIVDAPAPSYTSLCDIGVYSDCSLEDTRAAVAHFGSGSNDLTPRLNGSYALMASGHANGTTHSDMCCEEAAIFDDFVVGDNVFIYDAFEWSIVLEAPPEAEAFRFMYMFFSEEYDEYISSDFNDMFYVMLEASSTNDGEPTVINFTECRDSEAHYDFKCSEYQALKWGCEEGEFYCYVAINSAYSECCWYPHGSYYASNPEAPACPEGFSTTDISGTGFECASSVDSDGESTGSSTGWLKTAWPIDGGERFRITFHIHDAVDPSFDSEVIIDAFQFLTSEEQGTVVIE